MPALEAPLPCPWLFDVGHVPGVTDDGEGGGGHRRVQALRVLHGEPHVLRP